MEFPIDDLLQRLGAEFEEQARAKRLWLQIPPTSTIVSSDPLLLELILRNLISNAIKYTDRGGVTVECHDQPDCVLVEVIDTGRGIPTDKYTEIFEDFHQLDNPARDRTRGFGLGLATVERASRLLGYEISIRSEVGRGSVFSFRLPVGTDTRSEAVTTGGTAETNERDALVGRSILVVEDDPSILLALEMLLGDWGMEVHPAQSVGAVADLLAQLSGPPDVMAVDYRLPHGTSGTDAVALVHERWPRIPAVLMTGDTAPERLTEAKRSGYQLLHKPVDPEDLRRTLMICLGG